MHERHRVVADLDLRLAVALRRQALLGALLHLHSGQATGDRQRFPAPLRPVLSGWAWLGQRALWLAAGVIFARVFASRITLLIARLDTLFFSQQASDLWRWLLALVGGG